jgi:hypothetical protein
VIKITFKKRPRNTRLSAVGHPESDVDIKLDKKIIGWLSAPSWQTEDNKWGIWFHVMKNEPDNNPNCDWKNISLKIRFASEQEARDFIKLNINQISEKFKFKYTD